MSHNNYAIGARPFLAILFGGQELETTETHPKTKNIFSQHKHLRYNLIEHESYVQVIVKNNADFPLSDLSLTLDEKPIFLARLFPKTCFLRAGKIHTQSFPKDFSSADRTLQMNVSYHVDGKTYQETISYTY